METSRELRQRHVCSAKRVVVKVGTNVLASPGKHLDAARVESLCEQIAALTKGGRQVALVSSGAIGAGMGALDIAERPRTLPELQAAASVGQGRLMSCYDAAFQKHGLRAGQILLTWDDFDSRDRYLNACNTMRALFDLNCVPVINENDTISTDEIRFGENDQLAAHVTNLIRADLLILLTNVPGLYVRGSAPPAVRLMHESPEGVADVVDRVDDEVSRLAYAETTPGGSGGMASKLVAAGMATEAGEAAVIADGNEPDILGRIMAGEPVGTLFLPARKKLGSRKRWIRFTRRPRGAVVVDEGARRALLQGGKSLLPSGVCAVEGQFDPGDVIRIAGPDGKEFARGLSNYASADIERIKGLKTDRIESVLGHKYYDEIIHRDNMALL